MQFAPQIPPPGQLQVDPPLSRDDFLQEILHNIHLSAAAISSPSNATDGGTQALIMQSIMSTPAQEFAQIPANLILTVGQDFFLAKLMDGTLETTAQIGYLIVDYIVENNPRHILQAYWHLSQSLGFPYEPSLQGGLWRHLFKQALRRVCLIIIILL